MSEGTALLHLTVVAEKCAPLFFGALLLVPWLMTRRLPRSAPMIDRPEAPVTQTELGLLVLILSGALVLRVLWWNRGIPGTIMGGQVIAARADLAVQRGGLLARWWSVLRGRNPGGWLYDSPIIEPVVVVFQTIFGPRIHGIVIVGAFFGVMTALLAWYAGRLLHGPRFGLLFAALIAVSPLQVVWSRLGYRAMAAPPHVLLVLVLGALSARRGSVLLAALAGVVAYASVYNYELARAAIPLGIVAIFAATRAPIRRNARFIVLSGIFVVAIVGLAATLPRSSGMGTLWPTYQGYAGNRGEQTLVDFVRTNYESVRSTGRITLHDYFVANRAAVPQKPGWTWGIQYGGLTFLPVIGLGVIGALAVLARPRSALVWFSVFLVGLAIPAMACSSARRLLILDLGWCALAAVGLGSFARSPLLVRVPAPYRVFLAAVFLGALGTWTFAAMVALQDGPTQNGPAHLGLHSVPFALGCVGDIRSCPRCAEVGRSWEASIREGDLVMLVDSDLEREDPGGPAGLPVYGHLAAAASGMGDRFQELFPILWNVSFVPELRNYYPAGRHPMPFLRQLLGGIPYRSIVWHDERPTAWERALADRLAAIGTPVTTFSTPLGMRPGLQVRTTKAQEAAALDVLSAFVGEPATGQSCVSASRVRRVKAPFAARSLAVTGTSDGSAAPSWVALGYNEAFFGKDTWLLPGVRQVGFSTSEARVMRSDGYAETFRWPSREHTATTALTQLTPIGRACAAFAADNWWVVDAEVGGLRSATAHDWIPRLNWIGLTTNGQDDLVLAAADQRVVLLDVASHVVKADFAARVTPSHVEEFTECVPLVRGSGWIGVLQGFSRCMDMYADSGRPLGTLDLATVGANWTTTVVASGDFLVTAQPNMDVVTLKLDFSRCGLE